MKLTAGLLQLMEKSGIPERLNQLVMRKFFMERIDRISDSFVWPEKEDLAW